MLSGVYPVVQRDVGIALALFGAFGVGLALAVPDARLIGAAICLASAGLSIALYHRQLRTAPYWFFRRRVHLPTLTIDTVIVSAVVVLGLAVPAYVAVHYFQKPDIREIPPAELLSRTEAIVARLGDLQTQENIRTTELIRHNQAGIPELRNEITSKYRRDIQPEARRLTVEILRRQGVYKPYPHEIEWAMGFATIMYGNTAGATPFGEAAAFLDDLAHKLPLR